MPKNTIVIATVVGVDAVGGAYAKTKSINGVAKSEEVQWGIPKELNANLHDDIVITLTPDMSRFISYKDASTGKLLRLK